MADDQAPSPPGHNGISAEDMRNLKGAFRRIRICREQMRELGQEIARLYVQQAAKLNVDVAALREIEKWLRDPLRVETRDEQVARFRPDFGDVRHASIAEREALEAEKEAAKEARKARKSATGTEVATRDARQRAARRRVG
jgi:hypothetical protein